MKLPSAKYKDYQDIITAIGTALGLNSDETIKELCREGMHKKYLLKNGYISLLKANDFIREKLPVTKGYHFASSELLSLKDYLKIYNFPQIIRVNKTYIYYDGEEYYSMYSLDNGKVTEAWRLLLWK